jgi:hypothetical protein
MEEEEAMPERASLRERQVFRAEGSPSLGRSPVKG